MKAGLDQLLPGWETMPEPEARAACKRLDPRYRREAFRLYWELSVARPPPKPKKKKAKKKAEVKDGD